MILLIDNYDSFVFNLYQLIGTIEKNVVVKRNDAITIDEIATMAPDAIVLSPGPGRPSDAGICLDVVRAFSGKIPLLGVCLGHQAICEAFGGRIVHARELVHGKASQIEADTDSTLFKDLSPHLSVARYHSLTAEAQTLPSDLRVTAHCTGEIMAVEHCTHPTYGVQFHPESIMTPEWKTLLKNFITASHTNE